MAYDLFRETGGVLVNRKLIDQVPFHDKDVQEFYDVERCIGARIPKLSRWK